MAVKICPRDGPTAKEWVKKNPQSGHAGQLFCPKEGGGGSPRRLGRKGAQKVEPSVINGEKTKKKKKKKEVGLGRRETILKKRAGGV